MLQSKFYHCYKIVLLLVISCSFLGIARLNSDVSNTNKKLSIQQAPEDNIAETSVNVTLSETDTSYKRITSVNNPSGIQIDEVRRYFVLATLTTHAEIFLEFHMEFRVDALQWNNNFTLFKESEIVDFYRNFGVLKQLVPVNQSLLGIKSSVFETSEDNITTDTGTINLFLIHHIMIIEQTTVFLLFLPEPFKFDFNKLELGKLSDFHFRFEYFNEGTNGFLSEEVRIKAPGTSLEYIPSKKGYSGYIYLTSSPWDKEKVPPYERFIDRAFQNIIFTIILPAGQSIGFNFDSSFENRFGNDQISYTKDHNRISFEFQHDDYLPYYIELDSYIPFLEQFTLAEYASMVIGGFAGLLTLFKGLPYYLRRRTFNKVKNGLHVAAQQNNTSKFETLQNQVQEKFLKAKFSANQYKEIQQEIKILEPQLSKINERNNQ